MYLKYDLPGMRSEAKKKGTEVGSHRSGWAGVRSTAVWARIPGWLWMLGEETLHTSMSEKKERVWRPES